MTTHDTTSSIPAKRGSSALQMGPRKRASLSDPLVSHGRHFGRTVFALCNYPSLLTNGILRLEQMEDTPLEDFSAEERREHRVFEQLLDSYPGLLDRLKDGSDEEILHVGELIGKGAAGARGDDTKTLKSAVLDWISPKGEAIQPPLHRNSKIDRGFNHKLTGSLLCPAGLDWSDPQIFAVVKCQVCGDQWPIFLYAHYVYDHEDPWSGLLRSRLLVCAYKHVFTSPSSVDREPKATRSSNARLHGMNCVTMASIAYIATQVRFALSSSSVFSRTDTTTDSETFYHSLLDLLEDPEESKEVDELLTCQVFPTSSAAKRPISANSALSKIRQKRMALRQATNLHNISS
ncbi:hypothetical protein DEU56DRAFT_871539 [Suillus clintonianus]|uniref:uncharacterized protein n=1 Tax=Suillus clintonianus TaxID=1904413 RepID=UPI001B87C65D|nr:uncharacterized protein DEU56DRAFT_871539 [Suillus clintonianus]KAG2136453.1 hypothetical protein DEU56DRAFT_871539 [Suillus clintonianus]